MKKHLLLFLLIAVACDSFAQVVNRDSLLNELSHSKADTNRVLLLLSIGDAYENSDPDTARNYVRSAISLSEKLNYIKGLQKSYRSLAYIFVVQSRYDSMLHYSKLGLELARQHKDTFSIGVSLFNMGIGYRFMSDYENAVVYNLEGAKLLEGKGYKNIEAGLYDGLQTLYMQLAQYDQAIVYGEKAVVAGRSQANKNPLAVALNNVALSYMEVDRLDEAKKVLNEAIIISRQIENKSVEGSALNNLAEIAIREGNIDLVKPYSEKSLQIHRDIKSLEGMATSQRGLAIYYLNKKKFGAAKDLALASLKITDGNGLLFEKSQTLKLLSSISFAEHDFASGQKYLQESQQLDGKIFNQSLADKESSLKVRFEMEKQEIKIAELEAQHKLSQLAVRQREYLNYLLIGAALTLLAISILSYRNHKQKQVLHQQRITELENERKLAATEAVLRGEEQERTRLAKDLHDGLGGMLSGIKYSFTSMKGNLIMTPENQQAFERSMDMLDSSIKEMRRVAHNMMPETLVRFGLDTALRDYCNDINQSGALQVSYQSIGIGEEQLDQTIAITIYRIVQELISNAVKHAAARTGIVQVTKTDHTISITVEDDGTGFDVKKLESSKGIGWTNVQHRVDFLKGTLDINSAAGNGTSVHIEFTV